jgi:hypothetical protein
LLALITACTSRPGRGPGRAGVDGQPLRDAELLRLGVGQINQRHFSHVHLVGDQRGANP